MALPTKPVRGYSFTSNSTSNPTSQQPGTNMDAEYDRTNTAVSQLVDFVAVSTNADGTLKSSAVQAAIDAGTGGSPPGGDNIADIPSQQSAALSQAWAEHMPDELPADTLANAGITGQHWSARWWAAQAAQGSTAGSTAGAAPDYLLTTRTGIIIPYYVYVTNPYNDASFNSLLTLIRANQTVPVIVILNQPGSDGLGGPGPAADLAVAQMIRMLRAAGATVCGYVSTQNGTRNQALVRTDILLWNKLYAPSGAPLDGVFFDELPYAVGTNNANITLYKTYYDYARDNGYTLVIGNPGTQQISAWYDAHVADIYCCYENTSWPPLSTFNINPPSYISGATTDYDHEMFAVLVYNSAWSAVDFNNLAPWFGWIYATDNPSPASTGSPWSALPTYLATLFAAANTANSPGVSTFNTRSGAVTLTAADVTGTNVMAAPGAIGGTTPAAGTFSTAAITGTASSFRNLDFRSGASMRMRLSLNNTAEGGANAGSDLDLFTFTDAGGALLSPALRVTRSTGSLQTFAPLILPAANPTLATHAANKSYVDAVAAAAPGTGNVGRNLIHNSLFSVVQRGNGPFTPPPPSALFAADRWQIAAGSATDAATVNLVAASDGNRTQAGDEAMQTLCSIAVTGGVAASSYVEIYQTLEDVRRLAGKTVTVSFYAAVNVANAKIGVGLTQRFGTGGSPSAIVVINGQITPAIATSTFNRYSFTFALPSVSGKVMGTNNDSGTGLEFWLSAGSNLTTRSGGVTPQTGNFWLWGVQLEVGSVATVLEKPDNQQDVAKCQRFYYAGSFILQGYGGAGATFGGMFALPTLMRAVPFVAFTPTGNVNVGAVTVGNTYSAALLFNAVATATGSTQIVGNFTATADI